jgi:hypothetical protein
MRSLLSLLLALPLLGLSVAVFGGCHRAPPSTVEDCAAIGSVKERDECYLSLAPAVFRKDAAAGVAMVEQDIQDPVTRDFAWYTVTKEVDPNNPKYCQKIKDAALADRCNQIVNRPHLRRGLTGQESVPTGVPSDKPPPPPEPPTH